MAAMSMIQALNSALDVKLGRDPDVVTFGEDIGAGTNEVRRFLIGRELIGT